MYYLPCCQLIALLLTANLLCILDNSFRLWRLGCGKDSFVLSRYLKSFVATLSACPRWHLLIFRCCSTASPRPLVKWKPKSASQQQQEKDTPPVSWQFIKPPQPPSPLSPLLRPQHFCDLHMLAAWLWISLASWASFR